MNSTARFLQSHNSPGNLESFTKANKNRNKHKVRNYRGKGKS